MKSHPCTHHSSRRSSRAMTLVEMLVATGIGSLLVAGTITLFISGLISFASLGNYAILTGQSRMAMDLMSRDIRAATGVVSCQTNLSSKQFTLTNAFEGTTTTYAWDAATQTLTSRRSDGLTRTHLTGCTGWDFSFYQRSPKNNWTFYPTANLALCKLINMSWKCGRSTVGHPLNTESVLTAQIVLRNKP